MSYCHLCSGGYSNIILYFGLVADASNAVLDQMRGYVESKAACLGPLAAAPTVTGISPTFGSTAGGTPVTITGTGFQGFATVTLGGTAKATGVTIVNSTTITATTAAHTAGAVSVVVQNPDSQSATKASAYTYGDCSSVTLSNQTITTTEIFTSCASLTAGPAFRVASPGDVTLRAATRVTLTNGFSVGPGAGFSAGIDSLLQP